MQRIDHGHRPKSWNYKGWDKQGSWGWEEGLSKGLRKGQEEERQREAAFTHTRWEGDLLQVERSRSSMQVSMCKSSLLSEVLRFASSSQLQRTQQGHSWRHFAFSAEKK